MKFTIENNNNYKEVSRKEFFEKLTEYYSNPDLNKLRVEVGELFHAWYGTNIATGKELISKYCWAWNHDCIGFAGRVFGTVNDIKQGSEFGTIYKVGEEWYEEAILFDINDFVTENFGVDTVTFI